MKRYKVSVARRKAVVDFFTNALADSGYEILSPPNPGLAPFVLMVRSPAGKELELVCYAFLANKYRQGNRPKDEHRFQIKYGSDFKSYHEIFIDPKRKKRTLMFGVHLEEGIFVAVDPTMHNPTWFSKSFFFKDHQISEIHRQGWFAWPRPRQLTRGRRKRAAPGKEVPAEILLGFSPEYFGKYVELEHFATGMDPDSRQTLADRFMEEEPPASEPKELKPWEAARGKAGVFVSYAHADSHFVDSLVQYLESININCWRDVKSMAAGPMEEQIKKGIESNSVIIVLSKSSLGSDWVAWEASYAREQEKRTGRDVLCPIALDDSWLNSQWPPTLRQRISQLNVVDFSDWKNAARYTRALRKLVEGLGEYYFSAERDPRAPKHRE